MNVKLAKGKEKETMSGVDDSDNASITASGTLLRLASHLLPDGTDNVEATQRRNEELEAEAEQLRIRGEQLAVRVEARQNDNTRNEKE